MEETNKNVKTIFITCTFFREDNGCRIFDFYKEDNIRIYDGILSFHKNNIIKSITREEFENEYGDFMFYDINSYKVEWFYSGYTWNN